MSFKLLENIVVNDNGMVVIPEGAAISEAPITIDPQTAETQPEQDATSGHMEIIQQWIEKNRAAYGKNWPRVVDMLQPAIDAVQGGDISSLKAFSGKLADKAQSLAQANPRAAQAMDKIHTLYRQLLANSRNALGEAIDEIIAIVAESQEKIKALMG